MEDSIVIQSISGFNDFNSALQNNSDIAQITYIGHGGPGILFINDSLAGPDTNITGTGGEHSPVWVGPFDSTSVQQLDSFNVRPDAQIYLYSCFSGRPGLTYPSIAQSFADYFGVATYGGFFGTSFVNNRPETPLGYSFFAPNTPPKP